MSLSHEQRTKIKEVKEALKGTTVRERHMLAMMKQISDTMDAQIALAFNKGYRKYAKQKTKS